MMLNDDPLGAANGWYIGGTAPGLFWTNECQAVELEPNHLLITTHGMLTDRFQIESFDGGESLGEPYPISITSPLGGCEGSVVKVNDSLLVFSATVNPNPERYNMTIWTSSNQGSSWDYGFSVNPGRTAYSSLSVMPDGSSVGLLYERSNLTGFIFTPTHFSFLVVYPFP
jgi:sialidase-1